MWQAQAMVESPRLHRYLIHQDGNALSLSAALDLLGGDADFRSFFCETLAASPFSAFRWELPAMDSRSIKRNCQFVLHDAPQLNAIADANAFAEYFRAAPAKQLAIAFPNLGNDATLVVPTPHAAADTYAHLAVFLRQASTEQKHALLSLVAEKARATVSTRPFWLSTAGMGVAWLHVRLDSTPKYFGYAPYKTI